MNTFHVLRNDGSEDSFKLGASKWKCWLQSTAVTSTGQTERIKIWHHTEVRARRSCVDVRSQNGFSCTTLNFCHTTTLEILDAVQRTNYFHIHPCFDPLSGVGSQLQQAKKGIPNVPLPDFPGSSGRSKMPDTIPPVGSGSTLGFAVGCGKSEVLERRLNQMPEPSLPPSFNPK